RRFFCLRKLCLLSRLWRAKILEGKTIPEMNFFHLMLPKKEGFKRKESEDMSLDITLLCHLAAVL
ncbi:hypothetical protein, partial [Metabacillus arenae]|uniref:hypothetical protein n=1 Tax=Metabacillus arenae TaxID=2771434 RepID=UPI001CD04C22